MVKQIAYILFLVFFSVQVLAQHREESGVNLPKFYKNPFIHLYYSTEMQACHPQNMETSYL